MNVGLPVNQGRIHVNYRSRIRSLTALLGILLVGISPPVWGEPGMAPPLRQDAVKGPSPADLPKEALTASLAPPVPIADSTEIAPPAPPFQVGGYDPAGRRDPFTPVISQLAPGQTDPTLPPLQRVGLTDMNLIAIIWGAYGYTAMVQTPDGNGYTVRKGTRVGPNSGVVSAVTEKGIIVQERFTDVYGRKQEREYVKLLHPKEGLE
jgi:type IV pilus assembly protein PilP